MSDYILNWKVTYRDGSVLYEKTRDKQNSYANIDRTKLEAFQLFTENYEKLVYTLVLGEGQRLIYRRRVTKELSMTERDISEGDILYTIYLVGCQQTVNGKNIQSVAHIMENSIVVAPEFCTIDRYTGKLVHSDINLRLDEK